MRKLLNTLYVTDENAYLSLDGETVVCKSENKKDLQLPLANLESIVCFSYLGCSPALMGKCVDEGVSLVFHKPSGKFLARISGKVQGNVYTRVQQLEMFQKKQLELTQNTVAAKLANTRFLIERSCRDHPNLPNIDALHALSESLKLHTKMVLEETNIDVIRGIEGNCAKSYFDVFDGLILQNKEFFHMNGRTKHPPLDPINALLSFVYSIYTSEIVSALESVGLDSYIGFFHTLRSGRASLACDLVEEVRCIAERMSITLINLKVLDEKDFEKQVSGAVFLNETGRKKVLKAWQEKKREIFMHPHLKQKIPYGLLPFVQCNLLAKFVRGEIEEYPPFLVR